MCGKEWASAGKCRVSWDMKSSTERDWTGLYWIVMIGPIGPQETVLLRKANDKTLSLVYIFDNTEQVANLRW